MGVCLVIIGSMKDDLRAIFLNGHQFLYRDLFRHHNGGANPQFPGGPGHTLGVVTRRSGDDALFLFFGTQLKEAVVGSPHLE